MWKKNGGGVGGRCVAINSNMTPAKLYVQEVIK